MSTLHARATIKSADAGGFTAIASAPELDRDGEIVAAFAFEPLPASIPVHLDHTMRAADVVARAVPRYDSQGVLYIDARYGSTPDAQLVRQKVAEGLIDSVSIVFIGARYANSDGTPVVVSGELLAADLLTIPSNRGARVLSSRSYGGGNAHPAQALAARALAAAALALADTPPMSGAEVEAVLTDAKAFLAAGRAGSPATETKLAGILTTEGGRPAPGHGFSNDNETPRRVFHRAQHEWR